MLNFDLMLALDYQSRHNLQCLVGDTNVWFSLVVKVVDRQRLAASVAKNIIEK